MNDDVRILRQGTCHSLSGRSELTYEFGHNNKTIMFRITENTGAGHFCDHWVPLDDILKCLQAVKEPFSLSVFKPIYVSQSQNNFGFVGAVLVSEKLIVCEKRKYIHKDNKVFMAALNKLIKPTKATSKKTSKKEASK